MFWAGIGIGIVIAVVAVAATWWVLIRKVAKVQEQIDMTRGE